MTPLGRLTSIGLAQLLREAAPRADDFDTGKAIERPSIYELPGKHTDVGRLRSGSAQAWKLVCTSGEPKNEECRNGDSNERVVLVRELASAHDAYS